MKARLKETGEIIDLGGSVYDLDGYDYSWNSIELIPDKSSDSVRITAAIAAMQGMLANPNKFLMTSNNELIVESKIISGAVMYADALIRELENSKLNQEDKQK